MPASSFASHLNSSIDQFASTSHPFEANSCSTWLFLNLFDFAIQVVLQVIGFEFQFVHLMSYLLFVPVARSSRVFPYRFGAFEAGAFGIELLLPFGGLWLRPALSLGLDLLSTSGCPVADVATDCSLLILKYWLGAL
jgi:hypothetical protein